MSAPRPGGYPRDAVTAVVLAGGRARRMGGRDKGLVELGGRPMVAWTVAALAGQAARVIVNANRNAEAYRRATGCEVVPDAVGEFAGPLAGMASAMRACATPWVLTAPCDSPLVAADLAPRLWDALVDDDAEIAVAHDGERLQPVFALLSRDLADSMIAYLESGESKIDTWYARHRMAAADLSASPDTFLNINTPDEHAELERRLA